MSRYKIKARKRLIKSANALDNLRNDIDRFSERKKSQGVFEAATFAMELSKQVQAEVDKLRRTAASVDGDEY